MFREARAPVAAVAGGPEAHGAAARRDTSSVRPAGAAARPSTSRSSSLNDAFKVLCGDWQLRDGNPNDHSDAAYDDEVIGRLGARHRDPAAGARAWAGVRRLARYGPRLDGRCQGDRQGETRSSPASCATATTTSGWSCTRTSS